MPDLNGKPSKAYTPINDFTKLYVFTKSDLNAFLYAVSHTNVFDDIDIVFNNPLENMTSLRMYPYSVASNMTGEKTITQMVEIGKVRVDMGDGHASIDVTKATGEMIDFGSVTISPIEYNFLDYSPYTKIDLYLPYIGYVNIDPIYVFGKTVSIKYAVDYLTGGVTAYVLSNDNVIQICDGQIAVDIPITARNAAELSKNNLMTGVGVIGGAAITLATQGASAPIVAGLALSTSAGLVAANQQHYSGGNYGSGFSALYGPQKAFFRITRIISAEPADYAKHYGRPNGQTHRIGDLEGYTKVAAVHLENISTATQDELTEIERLLKTGVIL